jgi:hypothetical protein
LLPSGVLESIFTQLHAALNSLYLALFINFSRKKMILVRDVN